MAEGPRKLILAASCFDVCRRAFLKSFKAISLSSESTKTFLAVLAILIFTPANNVFGSTETIPLHHFNLSCENCHSSAPDKDNINSDISSLCSTPGCHDYDPILNHAVDISGQGNVPASMPLDDDQRITCLTCHDTSATSNSGNEGERLLQTLQDSDITFCGQCHTSMSGSTMEISHWQFSTRAHLETINPNSNASEKPVQFLGPLDKETHTCLSCHTDVKVTIPALHESESRKRARWATMTDHPVGVDYRSFALQKAPGTFFYPRANPARVRLFKGKVGCGSCHTLYAKNKSRTNETMERGRICLQCHDR